MANQSTDKYSNVISVYNLMTAANTLHYEEINVGLNLFDKAGLLVHRVEYYLPQSIQTEMILAADRLVFGLSQSNQADFDPDERAIIDLHAILTMQVGAVVSLGHIESPVVTDYTKLPGGGMLVAPKPLYCGLQTAGFAAATGMQTRIFFTILKLSPEDYFELLESRQFFG